MYNYVMLYLFEVSNVLSAVVGRRKNEVDELGGTLEFVCSSNVGTTLLLFCYRVVDVMFQYSYCTLYKCVYYHQFF